MIKSNILANFVGQGWTAAAGLLFVPIYIQYLGLEAYGLIGVVGVIRVWLSQFDVGMTPTINREMARFQAGSHTAQSIKDLLRSLECMTIVLALLVFSIVWGASRYLANSWVEAESLTPARISFAIKIAGAMLSLQFCEGIYRGSLIGLQKQVALNLQSSVMATLRHGGAWVVLALFSPTIEAFFAWQCIISMFQVIALGALVYSSLPSVTKRGRFSLLAIRAVWRFSTGMLGITMLSALLMQVDKVLLSRLLSLEEFGFYTLATTVTSVLGLLVSPVLQAVYPRVVQLVTQEKNEAVGACFHLVAQGVTALATPSLVILALYPEGLLFTWTTNIEVARTAGPLVSILALGTFGNTLMRVPYQFMLAHGWTSLVVRANVVAVFFFIPALVFSVPRYGVVGAAYIWLALNVGYITINTQFMHRKILIEEKWHWYLKDLLMPIACALLVGWIWRYAEPPIPSSRLVWVSFILAVGLSSLGATLVTSSNLRRYIVKFAKHAHDACSP